MRPRLGLLATRDFRLLWTGETTSFLGSTVSELAILLVAIRVLHAGVFAISAMVAAAWVPWVVIGLPVGAWVDRLPRRRIMIVADLVSLVAFLSVPVAAWSGVLTVAQLLVVSLVGGVASVFFKTAYRSVPSDPAQTGGLAGRQCQASGQRGGLQRGRPGRGRLARADRGRGDRGAGRRHQLRGLGPVPVPDPRPMNPSPRSVSGSICCARSAKGCGSSPVTRCCGRTRCSAS